MTRLEKYGLTGLVVIGGIGAVWFLARGGGSGLAATGAPTPAGQGYVTQVPAGVTQPQAIYAPASYSAPAGVTGPLPFTPASVVGAPLYDAIAAGYDRALGQAAAPYYPGGHNNRTNQRASAQLVPANDAAPPGACGCGGSGCDCCKDGATIPAFGSPVSQALSLAGNIGEAIKAALAERDLLRTLQGYGMESATGGAINFNPFTAGGSGPHAVG